MAAGMMNYGKLVWTPERDQKLRDMRAAGRKIGEIAIALSTTVSAVTGRSRRLGIADRPSPIGKPNPEKQAAAAKRPYISPERQAANLGDPLPAHHPIAVNALNALTWGILERRWEREEAQCLRGSI